MDLDTLLTCGQSFSWKKTAENVWSNVLEGRLFSLSQTDEGLRFYNHLCPKSDVNVNAVGVMSEEFVVSITSTRSRKRAVVKSLLEQPEIKSIKTETSENKTITLSSTTSSLDDRNGTGYSYDTDEMILREYFALNVDLNKYYKQWSTADPHFAKISESFHGIRILQQDPVENLFSFICSSNNHISRIGSMVMKLREHFGTKVGQVEGIDFYSFPTPEQLCVPGVESKLRELGFGYRYVASCGI